MHERRTTQAMDLGQAKSSNATGQLEINRQLRCDPLPRFQRRAAHRAAPTPAPHNDERSSVFESVRHSLPNQVDKAPTPDVVRAATSGGPEKIPKRDPVDHRKGLVVLYEKASFGRGLSETRCGVT